MDMKVSPTIEEGEALFDQGQYFECHELLEEIWMKSKGNYKLLLQGLIQAAAGFHKLGAGELEGAKKLFEQALQKLRIRTKDGELSGFKKKVLLKMKSVPREGLEPTRP